MGQLIFDMEVFSSVQKYEEHISHW
jgi:hypothetical protein